MSSETDKQIWVVHDSRLNEHEKRFTENARGIQAIEDTLHQLLERINEGVSKTQHKILDENKAIEMHLKDLTHKVDIDLLRMNEKIDTQTKYLRDEIQPIVLFKEKFSNLYLWSIVGGVVIGLTGFFTSELIKRFVDKANSPQMTVENLKAVPVRK